MTALNDYSVAQSLDQDPNDIFEIIKEYLELPRQLKKLIPSFNQNIVQIKHRFLITFIPKQQYLKFYLKDLNQLQFSKQIMLAAFRLLLTSYLLAICLSTYIHNEIVYVGTYATCSKSCSNQICSSSQKCISFRDSDGSSKNIFKLKVLTQKCWQLQSCAKFPKFYSFQSDKQCATKCSVNVFPGFGEHQLCHDQKLYHTKGYTMMCTQYAYSGTAYPDLCEIARSSATVHNSHALYIRNNEDII